MQIHVTDPHVFRPVETAAAVLLAANAVAPGDFFFRTDPYEYEREKMAIDILAGSDRFRKAVLAGAALSDLRSEWQGEHEKFIETFRAITHYPEERP